MNGIATAAAVAEHSDRLEIMAMLAMGAAHDIANQTAVIIGYSDVIGRGLLNCDSAANRALARSTESARCIDELARQLMAFASAYQPRLSRCDVNRILADQRRNLIDLLNQPPSASGLSTINYQLSTCCDIQLQMILGPDLPPVLADPMMLARAIANLAINARNAMRNQLDARLTIETEGGQRTEDGGQIGVKITVRDNGRGISPENIRRIMAEETFTTKTGHTGLGLGIVRSVAKSCGGKFSCESQLGAGAIFSIWIPQTQNAETLKR